MTAIVKGLVAAGNNGDAALNATDEYAQKQLEEIVRDLTECKGGLGGAGKGQDRGAEKGYVQFATWPCRGGRCHSEPHGW